jgi:hypothetical protein
LQPPIEQHTLQLPEIVVVVVESWKQKKHTMTASVGVSHMIDSVAAIVDFPSTHSKTVVVAAAASDRLVGIVQHTR